MGKSTASVESIPGDGFYWDHINRRTVVYYPSNLGVLHGFDASISGPSSSRSFPTIRRRAGDPLEVVGSRDTLKDVVALIVKRANNGVINHQVHARRCTPTVTGRCSCARITTVVHDTTGARCIV